jgi:hypothetical protein
VSLVWEGMYYRLHRRSLIVFFQFYFKKITWRVFVLVLFEDLAEFTSDSVAF